MKILPLTTSLDSKPVPPTEPGFPSVRYFQIHFEHLHEMISDLRQQIDQANQQIAELQQQLQVRSEVVGISPESYAGKDEASPNLDQSCRHSDTEAELTFVLD